jgi:hypothetical protein
MAELLTLDALMKATETDLPLPDRLATILGRPTIKVKMIDGGRLGCLYPLLPPEVVEGDPKTLSVRERVWLMAIPPAQRIQYRLEVENVKFHVLAQVALEPRLTFDEAERFGDAVNELYAAVLPPVATPAEAPEPEPDAVPVGA